MADWKTSQILPGVTFRDTDLLQRAFVHDSYVNENQMDASSSNERLEFLGDAVVNLAAAELVYDNFPALPEGQLTVIRSSLVCSATLAELASNLGLGEHLLLGRGEALSGGRTKRSNLASVFEAVIGALYLDQGPGRVLQVLSDLLKPQIQRVKRRGIRRSYKALLQEHVQQGDHAPPMYRLVDISGPDHERLFTVEVAVDGEPIERGVGRSKKAAEARAAEAALRKLTSRDTSSTPVLADM
ncbi:MAG: ribonuclease III [Chloroflexota bacterium]